MALPREKKPATAAVHAQRVAPKARKPLPLKAAVTSPMKTPSPTSTAKTPIMRRCMPAMGVPIVHAATVRTAAAAAAEEAEAEGIAVAVAAVAAEGEAEAEAVVIAAEIARASN